VRYSAMPEVFETLVYAACRELSAVPLLTDAQPPPFFTLHGGLSSLPNGLCCSTNHLMWLGVGIGVGNDNDQLRKSVFLTTDGIAYVDHFFGG
jgi:hypothetical protein